MAKPDSFIDFLWSTGRKKQFLTASFYSVLNKIFDLAPPLLIGLAVDTVTKKESSFLAGWGIQGQLEQISWICLATIIIWALESYYEYLFHVGWRNLAQDLQQDLRVKTYAHLQELDLAFYENENTGNLTTVVNDDINQLERFLNGGVNDILQVLTTVIVIGSIFFALSPQVALLSFIPTPLLLITSIWFQRKLAPRYHKMRSESGHLASILVNNLSGISSIKAYGAQKFETNRIDRQGQRYVDANREAIKFSSAFSPLIRMVVMMGFLATLYIGGKLTIQGELAVGSYSVMIFLVQRLLWPLTRLGETIDLYQRAKASGKRVEELLETKAQIVGGTHLLDFQKSRPLITFSHVQFAYSERENVLKDIDLEIAPGQTIALVGPTGSGKSSILKLILRFYDNQTGEIKIGEHSIRDYDLSSLRSQVSYVSQDAYIFSGTISENLSFGTQGATEEKIIEACKKAEVYEFIQSLPEGLNTQIGERGQKLSGGQKQRISMARAILKDAPIFILDEATSAVDNETEAAIQRSLKQVTKEKTTLVVAHRLSTIRNADKIYVLEAGKVVEKGPHEDLIDRKGLYHRLWSVQTGETRKHSPELND